MRPRVSVVMPCFNESASKLVQSLASLRDQSFADFECIIVDDSTDDVASAICRQITEDDERFVYIRPPRRLGLAGSLNRGARLARGEFVARFDTDDVCLPNRLAAQVAFFQNNPEIGVLGGAAEVIDEEGTSLYIRSYPTQHRWISRFMHLSAAVAHPAVMFKKSVFVRHGGYNEKLKYAEDLDLWLRWLNGGVRFANLKDVLIRYRLSGKPRSRLHWRSNLHVRLNNFRLSQVLLRCVGISVVACVFVVPSVMRAGISALAFLRRTKI